MCTTVIFAFIAPFFKVRLIRPIIMEKYSSPTRKKPRKLDFTTAIYGSTLLHDHGHVCLVFSIQVLVV